MKKIIIILIITLLTGCNYTELNDLAIASSIGIDYNNENNEYEITAQIMNIKSGEEKNTEEGTIIYESNGKTMSEAVNNFSIRYPRNVYFGHLEMCILGENAVNNKLDDIFDYFIRDSESKSLCYTLIAKEQKAKEILNPNNEKSKNFPTEDLKSVLVDSTNKTGTINKITLEEFLGKTLQTGIDPIIPTVTVTENKKNTSSSTIINGITTIKNKKVLPNIKKNPSIALNTINENYTSTTVNIKNNNDYISFIINNPKASIKTIIKNNKIIFNINIKLETNISEMDSKKWLKNKKVQEKFEKEIDNTFKNYVNELITYSKNNNVDPLGLGNILYKNYPKKYKNIKNKNIYKIAQINTKVKTEMFVHGNTNKGAL